MGIFDFMRDAGDRDDNIQDVTTVSPERTSELRGAAIQKKFAASGLVLGKVKVEVKGGDKVTLTGEVPDQETREKAVLMAGNQFGIAQVDDKLSIAGAAPGQTNPTGPSANAASGAGQSKMYTVQKGDSLSVIAKKELGDASLYKKIFEANRPMLSDPDKIYPGQVLRIPV